MFRVNIANVHGELLQVVEVGLESKAFQPPTIRERLNEARQKVPAETAGLLKGSLP